MYEGEGPLSPEAADKAFAEALVWCTHLLSTYRNFVQSPQKPEDLKEILGMDDKIRGYALMLLHDQEKYLKMKYGIDLHKDPYQ